MRSLRTLRLACGVAILAAGAFAACSDSPSSPATTEAVAGRGAALTDGLLGSVTTTATGTVNGVTTLVTGLLYLKPVTQASASRTIDAAGGTISVGNATLVVPKGALTARTTITVTRVAGNIVAYDMQPHGLRFAKPVTITVSTAGTNMSRSTPLADIQGAYYSHPGLLNQLLGLVLVDEFRPTTVAKDRSTVSFTTDHFSGYVVAMGRKGETATEE